MNQRVMHLFIFVILVLMLVPGDSLSASESDEKFSTLFENTFVFKTYLKDDSIKSEFTDGVVTLTGTVSDESHKTLAYNTAANISGVTAVDNHLNTLDDIATMKSDKWIGRKVKLALLFHRNVSALNTEVSVSDGIVTLKGEALNEAQKELSMEYAKDIEGVKDVKIEMTVASAPVQTPRTQAEKIDDASITALVKTALSHHHSTSALDIKVVAKTGEVTLTGIARNSAEKDLVSKIVNDIHGVSNVVNSMTLQ
ncbi:MAG: BON domain-containing protein [Candidatus Riflebacteria bacterium]|nr:BON domain-containing protein [Candidatus Riflebacteria bacterium]